MAHILYVNERNSELTIVSSEGEILQNHKVCYIPRKHIWAKGQYDGLVKQEGKPYTAPYGIQISNDMVEIRSLQVYEDLTGVM